MKVLHLHGLMALLLLPVQVQGISGLAVTVRQLALQKVSIGVSYRCPVRAWMQPMSSRILGRADQHSSNFPSCMSTTLGSRVKMPPTEVELLMAPKI